MKNTNEIELKATPRFKIGDFVRWYEAYADGCLGRDAGWGVVQSVRHHAYHGDYFTYEVLRNKHGDVMSFTEDYVEETSVNEVQTEKVKLQPQISSPGNISNQNAQLNATIKSLQDVVKQKDAQINTVTTQLLSLIHI